MAKYKDQIDNKYKDQIGSFGKKKYKNLIVSNLFNIYGPT